MIGEIIKHMISAAVGAGAGKLAVDACEHVAKPQSKFQRILLALTQTAVSIGAMSFMAGATKGFLDECTEFKLPARKRK